MSFRGFEGPPVDLCPSGFEPEGRGLGVALWLQVARRAKAQFNRRAEFAAKIQAVDEGEVCFGAQARITTAHGDCVRRAGQSQPQTRIVLQALTDFALDRSRKSGGGEARQIGSTEGSAWPSASEGLKRSVQTHAAAR